MNNIKKLRLDKGIKQSELAAYLNVAQGTLSYWEQGKYDIDNNSLFKLADYFNVTTDYILGFSDTPLPIQQSGDDEFWALRQEMSERKEMRTLFSLAKGATKKDLEFANDLLKRLRGGDE